MDKLAYQHVKQICVLLQQEIIEVAVVTSITLKHVEIIPTTAPVRSDHHHQHTNPVSYKPASLLAPNQQHRALEH